MKLFLKVLVLAVLVNMFLRSCGISLTGTNPLVGRPAPDFTLNTLSGRARNMTEWRGGQPAVIFFWATWCPHCRTQLQELSKQKQDIERKGIKIILVDLEESGQVVADYIRKREVAFDVMLDNEGIVGRQYNVRGLPAFFFVDHEGRIVAAGHYLPSGYADMLLGAGP
jgi:peroxiredoxin